MYPDTDLHLSETVSSLMTRTETVPETEVSIPFKQVTRLLSGEIFLLNLFYSERGNKNSLPPMW